MIFVEWSETLTRKDLTHRRFHRTLKIWWYFTTNDKKVDERSTSRFMTHQILTANLTNSCNNNNTKYYANSVWFRWVFPLYSSIGRSFLCWKTCYLQKRIFIIKKNKILQIILFPGSLLMKRSSNHSLWLFIILRFFFRQRAISFRKWVETIVSQTDIRA